MPNRSVLFRLIYLGALLASPVFARADSVSPSEQAGFGRLIFTLAPAAQVKAVANGGVLTLSFSRKVAIDPKMVVADSGGYIASGRIDPDGKTLRFALTQTVRLHTSSQGTRIAVDMAPSASNVAMPELQPPPPPPSAKPLDINALEQVKLRAGSYAHFTRLVFDWQKPVPYTVFPGAGKMTVRFAAQVRIDLSALTRFPPPWVKNASWHLDGASTVVELQTDSDSAYHDFRDGNKIVLDVLAPKTDASAYAPPGTAKPKATEITAVPPPAPSRVDGVSSAQAQAIAEAAKLAAATPRTPAKAPQPAAAPSPQTKAPTPAPQPQQTAQAAPAAPTTQVMDSKPIQGGVSLNFHGAGTRGSAVFIRGLTAWIVLQDAPAFDTAALEKALGNFPAGVEASSSPGVSVLRIALRAPAEIAARGVGADLRVVIAPQLPDQPIDIGFARNQDDPKRASLTTLLPGAQHVFQLLDPVAGDVLTIIPAAAGRAMLNEHDYVEFAALPTASGLVLTPFVDSLQVKITDARISITNPGGLALTPPQMPVAQSPAALARTGDGPSYLDFARWAGPPGGSFLNTERRLRAATARLSATDANHARLTLARFYLANHFAAEALGLIDMIQASDPGLQGDAQLATMRAAADYMMARYQDAHNDISGAGFDSDRHAAFWRGLIDTAMENWTQAHAELQEAGPVLRHYPTEWQARARLADAEASLGMGRLELADAALQKLPHDLNQRQALEAQLERARIFATENRYRAAAPLFDSVVKGGNEPLAVQAIFYNTNAALNAGAISTAQAIDTLERLRFRWRGDSLEMMTLRKLASLYFSEKKWRDGLRLLRVASHSFTNDAARHAEDDMRAAFVNLYLRGGADKLPPVESLSLFYDFIDLTPIGPDGDEMIRRMADRLVAVDLLDPAADLLSYQVNKRLDGVARAQVATKLTAIYLMDHKPQQAIDTLRLTQITGIPDDVAHQRLLLEARAFAALKQWDNALDLIGVDDAPDTRQLRADIYWESGNWAIAGQKAEGLVDTRWDDTVPLTDAERQTVLRAAVAYSLANDQTSLDRLHEHFAAKMKGTQDASAFAVLCQSIDLHGLAFSEAAAKIASVDTLEAFMKDFSKRHEMVATN
jgi:hypothetical protein